MHTFVEKPKAMQSTKSPEASPVSRPHVEQGHNPNSILNLQRTIGNQAVVGLLQGNSGQHNAVLTNTASLHFGRDFTPIPPHPKPSIKIQPKLAPTSINDRIACDKITQRNRLKADQSIGAMTVGTTARGLDVSADAEGLVSTPNFPDGFRWLQTVTTNDPSDTPVGAPLLPAPITYVDPRPNDDAKPFYWTDAEEAANLGHFKDAPGRPAHPTGTITWNAVLSLGGVNKKEVTRFDSVAYGFTLDSKGTVSVNGPSSPSSVAGHLGTLAAEFPGWKFK